MNTMKKVYICSPYRGDVEQNIRNACCYCRYAMVNGYMPIAPHLYFTRFLDDAAESERRTGMFMGAELLKECSELWAFGQPSEGMKEEIELAKRIGIPVRYFNTVLSVNNETVNSEPNTSDKTQQQEGNTHE